MKSIKNYLIPEGGGCEIGDLDYYFTDSCGEYDEDEWNEEVKKYATLFKKDPKQAIIDFINNVYFEDMLEYPDEIVKFLACIIYDQTI